MEDRSFMRGIAMAVSSGFIEFLEPLKWFFILGLALTLFDLKWGVKAARNRGETIRASRAFRRTVNKIVDFFCIVILFGLVEKAFGTPFDIHIFPAIGMALVYRYELSSALGNYFETRGIRVKINFFSHFFKKCDFIEITKIEDERKDNQSIEGN